VCGSLTSGRCNHMSKSLEMRACLKLNSRVLKDTRIHVLTRMFAEIATLMSVTAVGTYYAEICIPVLNILYYIFLSELLLLDIADC